jgi:hypothetical protein
MTRGSPAPLHTKCMRRPSTTTSRPRGDGLAQRTSEAAIARPAAITRMIPRLSWSGILLGLSYPALQTPPRIKRKPEVMPDHRPLSVDVRDFRKLALPNDTARRSFHKRRVSSRTAVRTLSRCQRALQRDGRFGPRRLLPS